MALSLSTLKRGLLVFWALWHSIVALTNVFDALKGLGVLDPGWGFASGNWDFMRSVTAVYATPHALVALLFAGVIAWEALAAVLFWRAFGGGMGTARNNRPAVTGAFVVSIALMAVFILVDEIFLAYDVESTHLRLFIAELVSLLAIVLLPDHDGDRA